VNSVIKTSVVLHSFIRTWEGLFCKSAENYAGNQSSHILNHDDDPGRQRLLRSQRLRNQLADYFLTPAGEILSGRSCKSCSQSSHHILNDDDDAGRQRLSRAQRLRNKLVDYFLTPAGAIPF
jgi:hypothetical protein